MTIYKTTFNMNGNLCGAIHKMSSECYGSAVRTWTYVYKSVVRAVMCKVT